MRKILLIIFLLSSSTCYADRVIVSYYPSGEIIYTYGVKEGDIKKVISNNSLIKNLPYDIFDRADLPLNPDGSFRDRDYWKGSKGKPIIIDSQKKETDRIALENKNKLLNEKLNALGLTREELKELVK